MYYGKQCTYDLAQILCETKNEVSTCEVLIVHILYSIHALLMSMFVLCWRFGVLGSVQSGLQILCVPVSTVERTSLVVLLPQTVP